MGGNLGAIGSSQLHHHTPPIPVEPAVAPVPVLEQESVLDLSQRSSEANVPSAEANRETDNQTQSRNEVNDQINVAR